MEGRIRRAKAPAYPHLWGASRDGPRVRGRPENRVVPGLVENGPRGSAFASSALHHVPVEGHGFRADRGPRGQKWMRTPASKLCEA